MNINLIVHQTWFTDREPQKVTENNKIVNILRGMNITTVFNYENVRHDVTIEIE